MKLLRFRTQKLYLNFRSTNKKTVVFHRLKEYDSHFIKQEICNVTPNNVERYVWLSSYKNKSYFLSTACNI